MFFSKASKRKLNLASVILQKIAYRALSWGIIDFAVIETFRDEFTQNRYFQEGRSKIPWPFGKHNKKPSEAFDLVPVIDGKLSWDHRHCCVLAGVILAAGKTLGINIRWGGDWNMNGVPITDQDFQDLVHYELTG